MGFYGHGFGYAGAGIVGDVGFDEPWSDDDWRKNVWGSADVSVVYTPLASSVVQDAKMQWAKLQDLIDMQAPSAGKAQARLSSLRGNLANAVAQVDSITRSHNYGGGSPQIPSGGTMTRAVWYNQINSLVRQFANESWPDATEEIAAAQAAADAEAARQAAHATAKAAVEAKNAAANAAAAAQAQQTQASIAAAQAAIVNAHAAQAAATAAAQAHQQAAAIAAEKHAATVSGLTTPLTIAAVAVPLAVVAYLALRKKGAAVGRYRARRRR